MIAALFVWSLLHLVLAIMYKVSTTFRHIVKEELINKIELSNYLEDELPNRFLVYASIPTILIILMYIF